MKRTFGRREKAGLAVIALSLAGAAIVAVILLSGGDDSGKSTTTTQVEQPVTDITPGPDQSGKSGSGSGSDSGNSGGSGDSTRGKDRGHLTPAPDFKAGVVVRGKAPSEVQTKLGGALDDGSLTLDELRGTPAVVTGLTTRCAFCGPEARLLEAEWKRWGPRGVLYLGLGVKEPDDAARQFADRFSLSFPVLGDASGQVARSFGFTGVPETIFVSRDGKIVGRVVGGASIGQLEVGANSARTGERFGTQRGGAHVPIQ